MHHPLCDARGEISFCAYNTGIGWRKIVEKMHMTATLSKWYEQHGRHEIFAGGKSVPLSSTAHSLLVREELVTQDVQHDLERLGIPKNAREEKLWRRRLSKAENEQMARLYRQLVLNEPIEPLVQLRGLKSKTPNVGIGVGD